MTTHREGKSPPLNGGVAEEHKYDFVRAAYEAQRKPRFAQRANDRKRQQLLQRQRNVRGAGGFMANGIVVTFCRLLYLVVTFARESLPMKLI
jgi:hypothetical protein